MKSRNDKINDAVAEFLDNGGSIIELRTPTDKEQKRSNRKAYLLNTKADKQSSRAALAGMNKREGKMVFSPVDRMKKR